MVTVGGPPLTGVKSSTVVAPLLCNMRLNIVGGNPTAVATRACKKQLVNLHVCLSQTCIAVLTSI